MGFRIGQFVNLVTKTSSGGEDRTLGRISAGSADSWTFQPVDDKFKDTSSASVGVKDENIEAAGLRKFASRTGTDQVVEVLFNTAVYGGGQSLIRKHKFLGPETTSFMVSDFLYEFVAKYYVQNMIPMIIPDAIEADKNSWLQMGDLQDAAKALPIVAIQQIYCKIMHKHKVSHRLLHRLIDAFGSITAANFLGRNLTDQMTAKKDKKNYNW